MPQITIVILQYRPDAAALRRTLASLAMQDTRDFAVVLGDDGSAQDYFAESRAYLAAHGITDVQTTKLQPNGGTVKNARNAVRAAATRWVLMLSPGDFLYDSETLRWWLGRLQADEPRVAFGRQAYFTPDPPQPTAGETPFDRAPYDPVAQHPGTGSCIGRDAAAVLVPDGQPVISGDAHPLHSEKTQGEILGQPHMVGHLVQRREEKRPLVHKPRAADPIVVQ